MRFTSLSQASFENIGNSKILLHKMKEANDYILTIQNIDSTDIEIIGRRDEGFIYGTLDKSELAEHVIIESITEKQLAELGSFLSQKFPKREKEQRNSA